MKKIIFKLFIFLNLTSLNLKPSENIYSDISQLYLPSLVEEIEINKETNVETKSMDIDKNLDKEKKKETEKTKSVQTEEEKPTEKEVTELFFSILSNNNNNNNNNEITNKNLYKSLEVFCGNVEPKENLLNKTDQTQTVMGKISLAKILFTPTDNMEILTKRQNAIKELVENQELFNKIEEKLKTIKEFEYQVAWFWKKLSTETQQNFDQFYFETEFLKKYNKNEAALNFLALTNTVCGPLFNLGLNTLNDFFNATINSYICAGSFDTKYISKHMIGNYNPIGWMEQIKKYNPNFNNKYVEGIAYLFWTEWKYYQIKNYIDSFKNTIKKIKQAGNIQDKVLGLANYVNSMKNIAQILKANKILADNIENLNEILKLGNIKNFDSTKTDNQNNPSGKLSEIEEFETLIKNLELDIFKDKNQKIFNKGKVFASFKIMQESKNYLIDSIETLGQIDAYMSIARLYKNFKDNKVKYNFVNFVKLDKPYLLIKNYWSPFIDADKAITNDIELGQNYYRNLIITGPNAGGKSTNLKAITINLLCAQTLTIAPAQEICITPFNKINTYLNITDTSGKESLFQAEMRRAAQLLNCIKNLDAKDFSFTIMDEIFTGTNPLEGICGAYGIAKKLASYQNSICLIATHFKKLTELEQDSCKAFMNYKVSVNKNPDGTFVYPFKLIPGINDQSIALDLLKNEGFDQDILQEAYRVMAEIAV